VLLAATARAGRVSANLRFGVNEGLFGTTIGDGCVRKSLFERRDFVLGRQLRGERSGDGVAGEQVLEAVPVVDVMEGGGAEGDQALLGVLVDPAHHDPDLEGGASGHGGERVGDTAGDGTADLGWGG